VALGVAGWLFWQIQACENACERMGYNTSVAYVGGACGCDNHAAMVQP
jgi:hypothetical protein